MKRHWIEYRETRTDSPMTYWVHREVGRKPWYQSTVFDPPFEPVVLGKGFAVMFVDFDGFTFVFASLAELRVAIEVLGRKLLPTTARLSAERGGGVGPNQHWLSRLPAAVMPWRYRDRAVSYLKKSLSEFERELGQTSA
jgi:hypothetical protein